MIRNYIGGQWLEPLAKQRLELKNPATGEPIGETPLDDGGDVALAVKRAAAAFPAWHEVPAASRIQHLFQLKQLLEGDFEQIARTITIENGKTLSEARGELRRGIENVEVACGIPSLVQGYNLENVAAGIDEFLFRQPLGVVAAITPFNFPAMIPLWFLPYAIACGNCFILKPSERTPLTAGKLFELIDQLDLPPGVLSLVHGGKATVDAILDHPAVRGVSFVGSTPVAKYVYGRAAAAGKRVQCQGGAKNHVVIMPDANDQMTLRAITDAAFGCAGQRCLAVSVAVTVGQAREPFREAIASRAGLLHTGNGLDEGVQMGPVITLDAKARIEAAVEQGTRDGGQVVVDGRGQQGNFVRPTVLDGVPARSILANMEIFGPVLNIVAAGDLNEAIGIIAKSQYGNASSIFTTSGAAARQFRHQAPTGNVGVNIGVAAPMAYFPFSGWKDSFFGNLHAQGRDAVEFYTDKKVVVERWPDAWP